MHDFALNKMYITEPDTGQQIGPYVLLSEVVSELDAVADGTLVGSFHAAARKLEKELPND